MESLTCNAVCPALVWCTNPSILPGSILRWNNSQYLAPSESARDYSDRLPTSLWAAKCEHPPREYLRGARVSHTSCKISERENAPERLTNSSRRLNSIPVSRMRSSPLYTCRLFVSILRFVTWRQNWECQKCPFVHPSQHRPIRASSSSGKTV